MKLEDCKSGVRVRVVGGGGSHPHLDQYGMIESYKPQLVQFPVLVALDKTVGVHAFGLHELEVVRG